MKEKLSAKEKVIVDKNSRPTAEEMKDLTSIFTVTEVEFALSSNNACLVRLRTRLSSPSPPI